MPSRPSHLFSTHTNSEPRKVERRRPDTARAPQTVIFRRLCIILLIAPWVIILALKTLFTTYGLAAQTFFFLLCLELAIITLVSLYLVNARLADLRVYEARREHERLLFSYARDGMLLIRVRDIPGSKAAGLSFVIQAENPAAVGRLRSIGQVESYVDRDIEDVFPKWLRSKLK